MIPKIMHLCWKDRDILTSDHVFPKHCVQPLIQLSPEWDAQLNLDHDVDEYLKQNLDRTDYERLKDRHIVEKSDVWRLIKLYTVGGLYCDIDRMCNTSMDDIVDPGNLCLLPTSQDSDFSQDFMCSAPSNPIYLHTLELNLARRAAGYDSVYFLGPQTYMHGVTKALLGEIVDVNPGKEVFDKIRGVICEMPFIKTYREDLPYDTILHRPTSASFDHESMKREFYASCGIKHWTGDW
jgi:mannosyltransferase OCH1-like enzyme